MNHPVALVMDRDFGEKAGVLSERMHTWLVDSEVNRAAVEAIWTRLNRDPTADARDRGLTLFRSPPDLGPGEAVAEILHTIVEHHPRVTVIEVYGIRDPQAHQGLRGDEIDRCLGCITGWLVDELIDRFIDRGIRIECPAMLGNDGDKNGPRSLPTLSPDERQDVLGVLLEKTGDRSSLANDPLRAFHRGFPIENLRRLLETEDPGLVREGEQIRHWPRVFAQRRHERSQKSPTKGSRCGNANDLLQAVRNNPVVSAEPLPVSVRLFAVAVAATVLGCRIGPTQINPASDSGGTDGGASRATTERRCFNVPDFRCDAKWERDAAQEAIVEHHLGSPYFFCYHSLELESKEPIEIKDRKEWDELHEWLLNVEESSYTCARIPKRQIWRNMAGVRVRSTVRGIRKPRADRRDVSEETKSRETHLIFTKGLVMGVHFSYSTTEDTWAVDELIDRAHSPWHRDWVSCDDAGQ